MKIKVEPGRVMVVLAEPKQLEEVMRIINGKVLTLDRYIKAVRGNENIDVVVVPAFPHLLGPALENMGIIEDIVRIARETGVGVVIVTNLIGVNNFSTLIMEGVSRLVWLHPQIPLEFIRTKILVGKR